MFAKQLRSVISALLLVSVVCTSAVFSIDDDKALSEAVESFRGWEVVGPAGGDVRVIAIDPRDKNRLYVSTLDGQIHTSDDGGRSWRLLVNLNQPELVLDQLMVDARDSKIIYTSGHRHKAPGGFFRTTDGGLTWTESKELRNESIHAMTQSTFDPKVLLAGAVSGVWISRNSGESWDKIESPTLPVNIDSLAMDPRNVSTMYAGTWWRAYKTTDAGQNWRLIKDGMIDDSDVFAITVDPRNPEHIVASACSGIYESNNAGERWAKIQGIPSQSRRTRDILQHPSIPGTVYAATTEGFWMTTNGGKNWMLTTQRNLEINSIAVHPDDPQRVYIGTNNYGVMVSTDGGKNFTQANGNFTSRFAYSITPDVEQPERLYAATHNTATGGGFFFVSDDGGATWHHPKTLDAGRIRTFVVRQDPVTPNLMYLGTNLGVYRSIDRGLSWTLLRPPKAKRPVKKKVTRTVAKKPVTPPPTPAPVRVPALDEKVKVLEFAPDGAMLAGTDKGLYRSADPVKGWEKIEITDGLNDNIFAIHVSPHRSNTIWVGTATSGVIVSHDGGLTWAKTDGAVDGIPVSSITSDPKRPDYIYVGTSQTFYLSRDAGKTWQRRGGGLALGNFTSILINPDNTDEIIISSSLDKDGGIYISVDAGNRWKRLDNKDIKLASRRFWSIAFDPQDPNRIFAGTHSSGVMKIERSPASAGSGT